MTKMGLDRAIPKIVNKTHKTKVKAKDVWIESCIFFVSLAPKYCAITTPAPVDNPIKNPTNILIIEVDCPTAARACELTKFPTT